MSKQLIFPAPLTVDYEEHTLPAPGPGQILTKAIVSGISHGTEMVSYLGKGPFMDMKMIEGRFFVPKESGDPSNYPFRYAGYDMISEVTAVGQGVANFAPGDRVFSPTPHRTECMLGAADCEVMKLSPGMLPEDAIMLSLATVAFTGVQDAEIKLGDVVVVFGGGIVGQLAVELAWLRGASRVFMVEPNAGRRAMAEARSAVETIDPLVSHPGAQIYAFNGKRYPDVVLECSGSVKGLQSAISASGIAGTVIAVGYYASPATDLMLGAEFITNRVTVKASMNVWNCPSRWPQQWDRARNLRTVLALIEKGKLDFSGFVSMRVPFMEAKRAYEAIRTDPSHMKVVLTY